MKRGRELGSLAQHRAYLGMPPKKGGRTPFPMAPSRVFAKQVTELSKRLKAINCRHAVIGLSGGLDSALALLVVSAAFDRLGFDRCGIHAITMPGFGTSKRTKGNAGLLCEGLGLELETISIAKACRQHFKDIGHDGKTPDITYENAQARMRTLILMDKANMTGGIVIGTGDMSEIALGWCTYNGDHMSMFAVNNGVPKTVVRKVCVAVGYIIISAIVMFNVEPDSFGTFFEAIYWSTVSLTTVGYGDLYPVTVLGRTVAMLSSFFGIAVVALPAGIVTAEYLNSLKEDGKRKT